MKNIKFITAKEAVKVVKSNDRVHLHSVAVTPHPLIHAMCERGRNKEFRNVRIQHIHTEGPAPYADREFEGIFQLESFFVGHNVRKQTQSGYAEASAEDLSMVHFTIAEVKFNEGITREWKNKTWWNLISGK